LAFFFFAFLAGAAQPFGLRERPGEPPVGDVLDGDPRGERDVVGLVARARGVVITGLAIGRTRLQKEYV
jgi:hypothetical protein